MTAPNIILPSKPIGHGASSPGSQRARRFTDTVYDNHKHPVKFPQGRPFTGEREFTSGTDRESITAGFITSDLQCGAYFCDNPDFGQTKDERLATLASAWVAPWLPKGGKKYMKFNYRRKTVEWLYEAVIADEQQALSMYWEAASKLAGENDVIDPDRPDAVPFRIRNLLGRPQTYMGQIRLAQACRAGDPWVLGMSESPNDELAKILGLKVQHIGGRAADAAFVAAPAPVEATPIVTPEQVLSVPVTEVAKMIADALQRHDADDRAKRKAAGDRLAAGKAKAKAARKTTEVLSG